MVDLALLTELLEDQLEKPLVCLSVSEKFFAMIVVDVSTGALESVVAVFDVFSIVFEPNERLTDNECLLAEFVALGICGTEDNLERLETGAAQTMVVLDVPECVFPLLG